MDSKPMSRWFVGTESGHTLWRCCRCDRIFVADSLTKSQRDGDSLAFCPSCLKPSSDVHCFRCGVRPAIPATGLCEECTYGR